ncbi:UNVERIFIED_ORG: serine/threonine protein phosphatase 1 [Rhodococcus erythropolis]
MSAELAFVGDIHGNLSALKGLWNLITRNQISHTIFLGDYINKGKQSAAVLDELLAHAATGKATLLAGNHEKALLHALERKDLSAFLKIGGAATIRSYIGNRVGPDVLDEFTTKLPRKHLDELRRMPMVYETDDLIAQHIPPQSPIHKYIISAHAPVGDLPRVGPYSSQLDTGCGSESGRLTALLWPGLNYLQVDSHGFQVS